MPTTDLFKPYLWLAAIGFAVGFLSYVAATPTPHQVTLELPSAWASQASVSSAAPSSGPSAGSGDWNFPKSI